ncbi:MAG TPA: transglutaminase-like cysteine peptidase [Alphaproteobacteria bacterium]|nr:transglutaminase-like cysteine peptidase [Alphaproteobacteria bacterium]
MAHHKGTFDHEFSQEPVWGRVLIWLLAVALALLVVLALVNGFNQARAANPSLFGWDEKRFDSIKPFTKWRGTLERHFQERKLKLGSCQSTLFNKCHLQDWKKFVGDLRGKQAMAQLDAVNRYMNRAPYITDPVNYGVPDYWATPRQFFVKDGDCEDYAIAKYMSLRSLGWPTEKMRIVVLQDQNLRVAHAVLAVYHKGRIYVLDNQISQVVTHDRIAHYRPIYSINEQSWWLHQRRQTAQAK